MNDKIFGFEKEKQLLKKIFEGSHGQSFILTGQEMIGKKTLVQTTAKATVISDTDNVISIDDIRRLKNVVSLKPFDGEWNAIIIDNAHLMTEEAQNALLKVLEEPNPSALLFLITSNPRELLPTILSRCQLIDCPSHTRRAYDELYESTDPPIGEAGLTPSQRDFLFQFTNGRIGLVKQIIEEKRFSRIKSSIEELSKLAKQSTHERFKWAETASEQTRPEMQNKILYWLLYMRTKQDNFARLLLRPLLELYQSVGAPQFNLQLALERFVLVL